MSQFQPCAGGIVHDDTGRLLVVRRGHAPSVGSWSIPGGRCLPGEDPRDTCVREVAEETGLAVEVVRFAGRVELPAPDGGIYLVDDFACQPVGGQLTPGDDATDARWVTSAQLAELDLVIGLIDALTEWGLLPRALP